MPTEVPVYKDVHACYGSSAGERMARARDPGQHAIATLGSPSSLPGARPCPAEAPERYQAIGAAFKAKYGQEPTLFTRAPGAGAQQGVVAPWGAAATLQTLTLLLHLRATVPAGRVNLIGEALPLEHGVARSGSPARLRPHSTHTLRIPPQESTLTTRATACCPWPSSRSAWSAPCTPRTRSPAHDSRSVAPTPEWP